MTNHDERPRDDRPDGDREAEGEETTASKRWVEPYEPDPTRGLPPFQPKPKEDVSKIFEDLRRETATPWDRRSLTPPATERPSAPSTPASAPADPSPAQPTSRPDPQPGRPDPGRPSEQVRPSSGAPEARPASPAVSRPTPTADPAGPPPRQPDRPRLDDDRTQAMPRADFRGPGEGEESRPAEKPPVREEATPEPQRARPEVTAPDVDRTMAIPAADLPTIARPPVSPPKSEPPRPMTAKPMVEGPRAEVRNDPPPPPRPPSTESARKAGVEVRRLRRGRLVIRKFDPWAVLRFSLVFYFCLNLIFLMGTAIIFGALKAFGVIANLEQLFREAGADVAVNGGTIFKWLFLIGLAGTVVWSAITVFMSFLYNLIADVVGGIEMLVTERE